MNKHTLTFFTDGVDEGTLIEVLDYLLLPLEDELESHWTIDTQPASERDLDWHVDRDRLWDEFAAECEEADRTDAILRARP